MEVSGRMADAFLLTRAFTYLSTAALKPNLLVQDSTVGASALAFIGILLLAGLVLYRSRLRLLSHALFYVLGVVESTVAMLSMFGLAVWSKCEGVQLALALIPLLSSAVCFYKAMRR